MLRSIPVRGPPPTRPLPFHFHCSRPQWPYPPYLWTSLRYTSNVCIITTHIVRPSSAHQSIPISPAPVSIRLRQPSPRRLFHPGPRAPLDAPAARRLAQTRNSRASLSPRSRPTQTLDGRSACSHRADHYASGRSPSLQRLAVLGSLYYTLGEQRMRQAPACSHVRLYGARTREIPAQLQRASGRGDSASSL